LNNNVSSQSDVLHVDFINVVTERNSCYNINERKSCGSNVNERFCPKSIKSMYLNYRSKVQIHVHLIRNMILMLADWHSIGFAL
jgi:hypothetical protein